MAQYRVNVSKPAENDIRDIYRYISGELSAPKAAAEAVRALRASISKLPNMPKIHAVVEDAHLAARGFRRFNMKNYSVFYVVHDDLCLVRIHRVIYGRRDWPNLL